MMSRNVMITILRGVFLILMLLTVNGIKAADSPNNEKLDSCKKIIDSMPHDSTRLQKCYVLIQENIDQYWALRLIEYAQKQAEDHHHLVWAMAFRGSKIRWCHRFHDWRLMDVFIKQQREKAIKHNEYGNYMSQIGESAIVMAQMGRFEQSWQYIQTMEKDLDNADEEILKKYEIYKYIVKAEYYKYHGEEAKRLSLLLAALENNVQTNPLQRISLHIELIDVFGQMGQYKEALANADSVRYIFNSFSPERQALPQSRGHVSEASLKKVEIYMKQGDYPNMKESMKVAEEYVNTTQPDHMGNIYYWWSKYYLGVKDYAKSQDFLDKAIAIYREYKTEEVAIRTELEKVPLLRAMGQPDKALAVYTQNLSRLDSVRRVMIYEQQCYLDELGEVQSQKERGEMMRAWRSNLMALVAVVLTVIVLSILAYVLYIRRKLKRNHLIIKEKLQEAKDVDKEKERFLRNITQLINDPLQQVVKGAKRLSEDTTMTNEEQTALVATNKEHVGRLLGLVNSVLDLSRLEAGMMKYTASNMDVVLALMEFVSSYNMRNMNTPIRIAYDVEGFEMTMDAMRFSKMIETLFSVPYCCTETIPYHRAIKVETNADGELVIIITGSLYADESQLDETERMVNRINKYVMRDFNSEYEITPSHDIVITLNPENKEK